METTNEELQGEIAERQRMERQKQEFLTMLTHDIRNPLSIVLSYTELLQEELAAGQEKEAYTEILPRLRSNALTVFSLVDSYLDASCLEDRPFHLTKETVDMNDLLRRVARHYDLGAKRRRLSLEFSLQHNAPPVRGNPVALVRIVSNLVHNALKFTPEHKKVILSSSSTAHEFTASVTDTGVGIAPENIPLLFEKYSRVEQSTSVRLHAIRASGPAGSACHGYGFSASLSARQHRKQVTAERPAQANQHEERCGGE